MTESQRTSPSIYYNDFYSVVSWCTSASDN